MALNREQIEQVLKVLAETSMRPAGGTEYPEEIRAFETMAQVEKITMEAEGFPFTVYQCVPYSSLIWQKGHLWALTIKVRG